MNLRERFEKLLKGQVNRGIYVWGGNGENLSEMQDPVAWIRSKEETKENADRAVKLYLRRKVAGVKEIRAFDCSGLVYWALKQLGIIKKDVTSRGLFALCKEIEEKDLQPTDFVFHHDGKQIVHVGVYVTGGEQIEARGRDVGVVRNKRKKGYWNRFGRYPGLYEPEPEPTPPTPEPTPEPGKTVYVKGQSVRVRAGDNTKTTCVGIVHKGDTFPLLGISESTGWYQIQYRGGTAWITNNARYTELR